MTETRVTGAPANEPTLSPAHPLDLTGRAVLVTGGNSGIGLGMARGLAAAGADICIWGRNPEKNAAAEKELSGFGTRVTVDGVDVADEASVVAGMARCVAAFGRLDACFANAAITGQMRNPRFLDSTLDDWRSVLRVDLDGTYLTLREAARHMVSGGAGGSLVATSSLAGQVFGAPREQAYAAAKAGIVALVRSIAVELGPSGIRANALLPGWTRSPQFDEWLGNPVVTERILPRIPLRRWGEPEDWTGIAVYLASPASSFHTGDVFRIDGGYGIF
jgi:NAD(P)-dependent dehydrogenase (short-subunit alcohol dehydrogenase family)